MNIRMPFFPSKPVLLSSLCLGALLLGGCGIGGKSKPANFFILSGLPEDTQPISSVSSDLSLGVGQVQIPKFLDRPQIVTLVADNQIGISEFNRWGESFQSGITRVLRENVSTYLGEQEVTAFPWLRSYPNDFVVHVVVLAFEVAPYRGEALFRVMYRITDPKQKNLYLVRESEFTRDLITGEADYSAIVVVMNQLVADLAKQIATEVSEMPLPPQNN